MTTSQSEDLMAGFIEESVNSIIDLPSVLKKFLEDCSNTGAINSVFRAIHSIKGNAGFFGLQTIKKFSHSLENTLDEIRNKKLNLSEELYRALVKGIDHLDELLREAAEGQISNDLNELENKILTEISAISNTAQQKSCAEVELEPLQKLADEMTSSGITQALDWATQLLDLLKQEEIEPTTDTQITASIPKPFELFDQTYVVAGDDVSEQISSILKHFDQAISSDISIEQELEKQLEADLKIIQDICQSSANEALIQLADSAANNFTAIQSSPLSLDTTLISVVWETLAPIVESLTAPNPAVIMLDQADQQQKIEPAQNESKQPSNKKERMIRIQENRLEEFMDEVSNLFITCERFKDVQRRLANRIKADALIEEFRQITLTLSSQTNGLQKSIAVLRKVPVRGLFSKFPKMARNLAEGLGKKIEVHLSGEETEVDKSIIEDLDAPLSHMIRNVADHALELPHERQARGVSEIGNLWLSAKTTRTRVIIEIKDDGRGIDPEKLKTKAVEKGIYTQAQVNDLSDQEAIELIFHPGFSTAEKVTDISGRGVGMDVVRTTIRDYEGEIQVKSQVNEGTTFTVEIPIRQAVVVLDGLLVHQNNDKFVVPFENILEVLEVRQNELHSCQGEAIVSIRGENYIAVELAAMLGLEQPAVTIAEDKDALRNAILITCKSGKVCLLVDEILSKRKVVVNSLQNILPNLSRVSGVAQLGGGELALVLNASGILSAIGSFEVIGG